MTFNAASIKFVALKREKHPERMHCKHGPRANDPPDSVLPRKSKSYNIKAQRALTKNKTNNCHQLHAHRRWPHDYWHIAKLSKLRSTNSQDSPSWTESLQPALRDGDSTTAVPMSFASTIAVLNTLNLVLAAPPLDTSFLSYLDDAEVKLIRHNHQKCKQRCFDCCSQGAVHRCTSPLSHLLLPVVFV